MKHAIITGASGDIGFAIAQRLTQEGWDLSLLDREALDSSRYDALTQMAPLCSVKFYEVDITRQDEFQRTIEQIGQNCGYIGALVNNAGIYPIVPFEEYTHTLWNDVLAVNLTAAFTCVQLVLPYMKEKGGRIVNITSTGAHIGSRDVAYAASKAGMIGFTKSCARNLAKYGITVNAVAPGLIDTRMSRRMKIQDRQNNIHATLVGRIGMPRDVSGAISFLLSPDADYITGFVIDVNGGLYLR